MSGKVFIVTGASAGIGFEVTKILCEAGHDVIMATRNEEKTKRAIDKIKKKLPNALATYLHLDLGDLDSVRKFVSEFQSTGKKLHVLINNAGLGLNFKDTKRQFTKNNFEVTMGTNHLGHFLLTNLLMNDLKKTAGEAGEARVIVLGSSMHDPETNKKWMASIQTLDLEDLFLNKENSFSGMQAYKNSKAANIMFTYELSKKLEGSNVTANVICPGFVPTTDLMRNASKASKFFCRYVLRFTKMSRSTHQAAQAVVTLATDEKYKGVTGKYFKDDQEIKSSEETLDEGKQKKLWELSGGYCKLPGYEPLEAPAPPVEVKAVEAEKDGKVEEKVGIMGNVQNGVSQTIENVKTEANEAKEMTDNVVEKVKDELKAKVEEIKDKGEELKNDVTEKVQKEVQEVTKKGEETIEKIENGVKVAIKDLSNGLKTEVTTDTPEKIIASEVKSDLQVETKTEVATEG